MRNAASSDEQAHGYFLSVTIGGIGAATFRAIILYQLLASPMARPAE